MSPEPAPAFYTELMRELGALCAARRSGTMFIATADNQSARVGIRDGEIVSLVFRNRRGLEAIEHIRKIAGGRFSFSDTIVDRVASGDLPATADLLGLLAGRSPAPPVPKPASPPSPASSPSPRTSSALSPQLAKVQAVIESELTEFVGPIAPLLCREHLARAAAAGPSLDVPALIESIARDIGDRAKADRFRQQALGRLRDR